jgi:hypothetical protein
MSITEIRALPREEKWKLMEVLWSDLSENETALESLDGHLAALQATEARWKSGEEAPMDWSKAKEELRTRCA